MTVGMRRVAMSWWEVAEMVYERRAGLTWQQVGALHGVSCHKAKREVESFARMAGRKVVPA